MVETVIYESKPEAQSDPDNEDAVSSNKEKI